MRFKRITKVAFETAMKRNKKVTSIDKEIVLSTSLLWREVVEEIAKVYADVSLNHLLWIMQLCSLFANPRQFDVVLCDIYVGRYTLR
jgi:3-isopropylmalate dehydrogenase